MHVTASLYAKHYFELRALAGSDNNFPEPLNKEQASGLQARSAYQEQQCSSDDMKRAVAMAPSGRNSADGAGARGRTILSGGRTQ